MFDFYRQPLFHLHVTVVSFINFDPLLDVSTFVRAVKTSFLVGVLKEAPSCESPANQQLF